MRLIISRRRRSLRFSYAAAGLLAVAIGCASSTPRESSMASPSARHGATQTGSRSSHLSGAELQDISALSTLDAVQKLRPEFLRVSPRSVGGIDASGPTVYVNGVYNGGVSWLDMIPPAQIREISFLNPAEARLRLGAGCACGGGVLLVSTARERFP